MKVETILLVAAVGAVIYLATRPAAAAGSSGELDGHETQPQPETDDGYAWYDPRGWGDALNDVGDWFDGDGADSGGGDAMYGDAML